MYFILRNNMFLYMLYILTFWVKTYKLSSQDIKKSVESKVILLLSIYMYLTLFWEDFVLFSNYVYVYMFVR